jgi:hypothetical protein
MKHLIQLMLVVLAATTSAIAGDEIAAQAHREIPARVDSGFRPEPGVEYTLAAGTLWHPAREAEQGPAERDSSMACTLANEFVYRTALAKEYVVPAAQAAPAKDGWHQVGFTSQDGKSRLLVEVQAERRVLRIRPPVGEQAGAPVPAAPAVNTIDRTEMTNAFGIYLFAEPVDRRIAARGSGDWSRLRLSEPPLISAADIISYDFAVHAMKLRPEALARIPRPPVAGTPFALVANGERIYLGVFTTGLSSMTFAVPSIMVDRPMMVTNQPSDTLVIERAYPSPRFGVGPDPRGDERIRSALKTLHKLNGAE